jgi:predicted metalloendopeptidase
MKNQRRNKASKKRTKKVNPNNKTAKKSRIISFASNYEKDLLSGQSKTIEQIITETKGNKLNNAINSQLIKYFETPFTKKNEHLKKNDYYSYINNSWEKEIRIMSKELKYLTKLDDFRLVQYRVYEELNNLIKQYIDKNGSNLVAHKLKDFYYSALKFNSIMSSRTFLDKIVKQVDTLRKDRTNIWKMLALVNKSELTNDVGPFIWRYSLDKKDSTKYINYMEPHQFAIFDINIYTYGSGIVLDEYKKKYYKQFIDHITQLFHVTLPHDKKMNAHDVFDVEQIFFNLLGELDPSIKLNNEYYYTISAKEALDKYGFNWNEYCVELGYKESDIPDFFVTSNPNYFKFCTETLLNEWHTEKWRSYWIWIFVRYVSRFTEKWEEVYFSFYGRATEGMTESFRKSPTHAAVLYTAYAFNPIMNNEYIHVSYDESNVVYTSTLAHLLREIYITRVDRNTWLSPKTLEYAKFKLSKIGFKIGNDLMKGDYNEILPLLDFNQNQFLDNLVKVSEWRHRLFITGKTDIIKTLAIFDWTRYPAQITSLPSYMVNAQYIPQLNSIVVSNAYLQKPFINNEERGVTYNLAYIGFTIGHELSHSLDDMGSQYDVNGNLHNWWTERDTKAFVNIQNNIIKQYDVFTGYDGVKFDATYGLGEEMADISGLNICEEYLRDFCMKNDYTPIMIYHYFEEFYIFFAHQMRQDMSKQALQYELVTNPHPVDKYRTNVTLSRSEMFRSIYNIKKGEHMYWNNNTGIWN